MPAHTITRTTGIVAACALVMTGTAVLLPATEAGAASGTVTGAQSFTRRGQPSPAQAGRAALLGIAATSARNAWAVGATGYLFGTTARALVVRWNGHFWQ
jgi:hypothetical protein